MSPLLSFLEDWEPLDIDLPDIDDLYPLDDINL